MSAYRKAADMPAEPEPPKPSWWTKERQVATTLLTTWAMINVGCVMVAWGHLTVQLLGQGVIINAVAGGFAGIAYLTFPR